MFFVAIFKRKESIQGPTLLEPSGWRFCGPLGPRNPPEELGSPACPAKTQDEKAKRPNVFTIHKALQRLQLVL